MGVTGLTRGQHLAENLGVPGGVTAMMIITGVMHWFWGQKDQIGCERASYQRGPDPCTASGRTFPEGETSATDVRSPTWRRQASVSHSFLRPPIAKLKCANVCVLLGQGGEGRRDPVTRKAGFAQEPHQP
jgi:hypothetical protein